MKDNFSSLSDNYARYRPTYPAALYDYLLSVVPGRTAVWDCGTGNGQVAQDLAPHFNNVYATDISEQQISSAVTNPKIKYSIQRAEQTDFPDDFFDLITVAQAIHWFEFDQFYHEASRTIRHNGILAVMGYAGILVSPEIDKLISYFYRDVVGPFWDAERRYIDEYYQTIPFPFPELPSVVLQNQADWTLDHLIGYLGTWSAVKHFRDQKGWNPLEEIQDALTATWGMAETRPVRFPILLRVARINKNR